MAPRATLAQTVRPEIVATFPHDAQAYTQGLLLRAGRFFESTGLEGRSSLRRVLPATGQVEQRVELADDLFGEGLALVDDRLIQLTWQDQIALVYDLDFRRVGTFRYQGEGWGLCNDGSRLVMSDGSSRLYFRDSETFALRGEIEVTRNGAPVTRLNELECVGQLVYANVFQTDTIVRIDPTSGEVLTTIDASGLLSDAEAADADVLNGIAFDEITGHFFLTGKLWPKLFEVRFAFDAFGDARSADGGGERPSDAGADIAEDGSSSEGANLSDNTTPSDAGMTDAGVGTRGRADAANASKADAGRAAADAGRSERPAQEPQEEVESEAAAGRDPSSAQAPDAGSGCSVQARRDRAPRAAWFALLLALARLGSPARSAALRCLRSAGLRLRERRPAGHRG